MDWETSPNGSPQGLIRNWILPQVPYLIVLTLGILFLGDATIATLPGYFIFIPFCLSILLFGLPHGAIDDQVLVMVLPQEIPKWKRRIFAFTVYIIISGLYLLLWILLPTFSFLLFLGITWFHWGQGDLYQLKHAYKIPYLNHSFMGMGSLLVRGSLPMFLTFLVYPDIYLSIASWTIAILDSSENPILLSTSFLLANPGLFLAYSLFLTLYLLVAAILCRNSNFIFWLLDACEILFLFILFSNIHPLLSVGLYFCLWHSVRHLARLDFWFQKPRPNKGPAAFRPFPVGLLVKTVPNTLISIVGLLAFTAIYQVRVGDLQSMLGLYLILIAILTLPHLGVVSLMDLKESNDKPSF